MGFGIKTRLLRMLRRRQFRRDWPRFRAMAIADSRFALRNEDLYPCLDDATTETGFDAHYLYHTAWAMRVMVRLMPSKHVDIGSSLYFAALASALLPLEHYDYRPPRLTLSGLTCGRADLLALPFADASVASLSCMHVMEHVGLGRYGDPMDPQADLLAARELGRVVGPGGSLLIVTPLGRPRLQFNAHRIYSPEQLLAMFPGFSIAEFCLVTDQGDFVQDATKELADGQDYGCGCLWLKKNG